MKKQPVLALAAVIIFAVILNLPLTSELFPLAPFLYFILVPVFVWAFLTLITTATTGQPLLPIYRPDTTNTPVVLNADKQAIRRVVKDPVSNEEKIVFGPEGTTYREACRSSWPFSGIRRSEQWIVVDERGNDISNQVLESYSGLAQIIVHIGAVQQDNLPIYLSEEDQARNEEEDISLGVEFYD
jgi:hypothetical protein